MTKRRNREEGGYALLLVLLLAAGIAISLYMEMPRIAFETQRNREEMVVDRAEQYKRAIQLFVRANKRYPTKIEDLESFNDKRYLRHRFVNPMTGKDDWRLVHVAPNGMLTDSLVQKSTNPLGGKDDKNQDQTTASNADSSAGDPNAQPAAWDAKRQRPSDVTQLTSTGTGTGLPPGADPQQPGYIAPQPQYPGQPQYPQQPGQINPVQQYPGQTYPGQPVQPGQAVPPGQPGQPFPIQQIPGQPGQPFPVQQIPVQPGQPYPVQQIPGQQYPGQPIPGQPFPVPVQPGQQPVQPYPGQPVGGPPLPGQMYPGQSQYPGQPPQYPGQMQPGQPYPGQQQLPVQTNVQPPGSPTTGGFGTPQSNAGINAVRDQIFGGSNRSAFNNNPQQGGLGTGIAGVGVPAETKGVGIMMIKERSKYREWEFIYDPKEDKTIVGAAGANPGNNSQGGSPGTTNPLGSTGPSNPPR